MNPNAAAVAAVIACTSLLSTSQARETVLVIGDSLSREYQFEFPVFTEARNWVELLAVHRPDDFYFGPLESSDLGLLADACDFFSLDNAVCNAIGEDGELDRYRYNWAIPTYSAASYAGDLTGGSLFQGLFQDLINDDFDDVDAVVVFLGGNDIDRVYSSIYNGNTETANSSIGRIEDDLEDIIDFVLRDTPGMPMVLVNVPHVGATPEVKGQYPTDQVKTTRVTAALETLATNLRALAAEKNIGYADILTLTTELLPDAPYCIGGVPFSNEGTDTGAAEKLWLGGDLSQNFHPNTNGQALLANAIIAGFNEKYMLGIAPFGEMEIVEDLLGLPTPLASWAEGFGLPIDQRQAGDDPEGDGLINLIEFALDLDPSKPSQLPRPVCESSTVRFDYQLRPQACDHISVTPEFSRDLSHWQAVPSENIAEFPDNTYRVTLDKAGPGTYLRLRIKSH
jgi:lysophospholipase L1-like esterase